MLVCRRPKKAFNVHCRGEVLKDKGAAVAKKERRVSTPTRDAKRPGKAEVQIHLITASTGDLLYRLLSVAVNQFSSVSIRIIPHHLAETLDKVSAALDKIEAQTASSGTRQIVVHGVADPAAKQLIRQRCVLSLTHQFDATGPLIGFLSECVGTLPDNDVHRLHRVDSNYQRRIDAMEYTIQHDDGLGLDTIESAEIVIVGISRVSKSPTSLYLGARGYRVANVSIVPGVPIPEELAKVKGRIAALTMQPRRLQEIRAQRLTAAGAGTEPTAYNSLDAIIREIVACDAEFRRRGYPLIDVTQFTIEQTAAAIIDSLGISPR
jgi:[pyruvate, water dikinase]-phosphate phosphotransferase / [pyruvate, water dikinase] kinase